MQIKILKNVLDKNNDLAVKNKELLHQNNIRMINFISSPGAGKTTVLEKTLPLLKKKFRPGIIEGDAYTARDAERLQKFDIPIVQVNTEGACHLDSNSISEALKEFNLNDLDLIIVENVGNLICPVGFDLGEDFRIAVLSTTEGDDKPSKYPMLFREAKAVILNKIDLLPYIDFDKELIFNEIRNMNPHIQIFEVSATKNEGIENWFKWLEKNLS